MEALSVEHVAAVGFRRWGADLHRLGVVAEAGGQRAAAELAEVRPDGTVVLSAPVGALTPLAGADRLQLSFRADRAAARRWRVAPLHTGEFRVDPDGAGAWARFRAAPPEGQHPLDPAPAVVLRGPAYFRRGFAAQLVALSPYQGELAAVADSGRCLSPGLVMELETWLPWLGTRRLRVQLSGYREEAGGTRLGFRVLDRASVRAAAAILVGTAEGFHFDRLRAAGVRPGRVLRHLTLRTVADPAGFRAALDVRLVGNRNFGRLTDVRDGHDVADHLDPYSVNFVAQLGDKTLGTGRMVINSGDRSRSEIEAETDGLPDWVWDGGFVEVSRMAVHPDYRGSGVLVALFREIARLAFQLDCRYLALDAIEKLVPIYERVGATRLPIVKKHPYSKETVHVMVIDVGAQLGRVDHRSPSWQYVFGPVLRHHVDSSAPERAAAFVHGVGHVPFRLKRGLSRLSRTPR